MAESSVGQGGVSVVPGSTQGVFPQWFGMYYATVASNADPENLGRVQLTVPQVLGTTLSTWAWALTTPAFAGATTTANLTPPPVGTVVACMFLGGDLSNPAYLLLTTSASTVTTTVSTGGAGSTTPTGGGTTTSGGGTGGGGTGGGIVGGGGGTGGSGSGSSTTPSVATTSLPGATQGESYSAVLSAAGGTAPYTWSISSGSLPSWATLNSSTGVISGMPVAAGSTTVTVEATDAGSLTATQSLTITVTASTLLPTGVSGSWTLVLNDDFDVAYPTPYGTGPNPNLWSDHFVNGDMFRTNDDGEIQWYPHGYYGHSVANSNLTLTARLENPRTIDPTCPSGDMIPGDSSSNPGSATSAMIASWPGYNFTYGFVEIRMQHPATNVNQWPQMAMFTRDNVWPPEIDIDEYNPPSHVDQTHNGYFDANSDPYQSYYFSSDGNYHVWGLQLTSSHVTFYYDGTQTFQTSYDGNAFTWFLTYTLAVRPGASSGYPYAVNIDYIRAWVPTGVPAPPTVTSISPATGIGASGNLTVNFTTVTGATSYRATASPTDAMADGYGGADVTDTTRFRATGSTSPLTITGLPASVRWNVTVAAENGTGWSQESLPCGPMIVEIQLLTTSLPTAATGVAYTAALAAKAGNPPYTWSISAGSLPTGLSLNSSTGVITGTPTVAGTTSFTVKVSGASGWTGYTTVANNATATMSITVGTGGGGGTTTGGTGTTLNPSWDQTGSYDLIFDDEFTGTSLNTTYWGEGWQAKTGTSGPINTSETANYSSANVSVANSYLNLALTTGGTGGYTDLGACVTTNPNGTGGTTGFSFTYPAAVEALVYLPPTGTQAANWPAVWVAGQTWPATGEIDIVEGLSGATAYHVHDSTNPNGIGGNSATALTGWHTVGIAWTESLITWYYDGKQVGTEPADGFTGPLYLILNNTISASSVALVPATMQVDWVRVWTPMTPGGTITGTTGTGGTSGTGTGSTGGGNTSIAWTEVASETFATNTLSSNFVVYNNGQATAYTANSWMASHVSINTSTQQLISSATGSGGERVGGAYYWAGASNKAMMMYGAWEVDFYNTSQAGYAPVLLMWPIPDDGNWPIDGEIDIVELGVTTSATTTFTGGSANYHLDTTAGSSRALHFSFPGAIDWTKPHTVRMEWQPSYITTYVDAKSVATTTDTSYIPHTKAMRLTMQQEFYGVSDSQISSLNAQTIVTGLRAYSSPSSKAYSG